MCSEYIQSAEFISRDTDSLIAFAETFLDKFPVTLSVAQHCWENMWWEDVNIYGKHGTPATDVGAYVQSNALMLIAEHSQFQTQTLRRQALVERLKGVSEMWAESAQRLDSLIEAKERLVVNIRANMEEKTWL